MKKLLFLVAFVVTTVCYGQTRQPRTYVLIHGAWSGGWDYAKVDSILTAEGDRVFRPTLTGVGERAHLSNARVNLTTYITDVINVIRFENLHNVILVGHSFGGMVISGVAEQIPERIRQLIYLDAMVPNDGESAKAVCGELWEAMMKQNIRDSVMAYPFGTPKPTPPHDIPQPLKTFTEPLRISNSQAKKIPAAFVLMTRNGKSDADKDKMGVARARARNWKVYTLEGGHYAMREQPGNLVKKFEEVMRESPKPN